MQLVLFYIFCLSSYRPTPVWRNNRLKIQDKVTRTDKSMSNVLGLEPTVRFCKTLVNLIMSQFELELADT